MSKSTAKKKQKISKANKGKPSAFKGKHHSEEAKRIISQKRLLRVIPRKDTTIEVKIQQELTRRGITYAKHYPIKGQPDIAFPKHKIAIFLDGDYWHTRPKVQKRDKEVNTFLQSIGWIVLRYREKRINKETEKIVDEILEVLSQTMLSTTIPSLSS